MSGGGKAAVGEESKCPLPEKADKGDGPVLSPLQRKSRPIAPNSRRCTAPLQPLALQPLLHPLSPSSAVAPLPAEDSVPAATAASSDAPPPVSSSNHGHPSTRSGSIATPGSSAPVLCASPAPALAMDELSMEPLSLHPTLGDAAALPAAAAGPLPSLASTTQRRAKSSRTLSDFACAALLSQATDADSLLGLTRGVLPGVGGEGSDPSTPNGGPRCVVKSNKQVLTPLEPHSRRTVTMTSLPTLAELSTS